MFVIVKTTSQNVVQTLDNWYKGRSREYIQKNEWILRKFGVGAYMFDLTPATLALLLELKVRHDGDVMIFIIEPIRNVEFPEMVRQEVKKCIDKKIFLTQETLEKLNSKMKIRYSMRLKEKLL